MPIALAFFSFLCLFVLEWPLARRSGARFSPRNLLGTWSFWRRLLYALLFSAVVLLIATQEFSSLLSLSGQSLAIAAGATIVFTLLSLCLRLYADSGRVRALFCLIFSLLLAVFAEVVLFNYRAIATSTLEPIDITNRFGVANVTSEIDDEGFYDIHPGRRLVLNTSGLDIELETLYIELEAYLDGSPIALYTVSMQATDDGNSNLLGLPTRILDSTVAASRYLTLHLHGKTDLLRLSIEAEMDRVAIRSITANARIPFSFSAARVACVFVITLLVFALRPGSPLYEPRLAPFDKKRATCTALVLLLLFGVCLSLTNTTPWLTENIATHQEQYNDLAEAFRHGKLYLFQHEPPEFLKEMDNPYDTHARDILCEKYGESIYWDAAYYDGNYYVYFGVLPVLLLYLPAQLLTGMPLLNGVAMLILAPFYLLAVFFLVYELIRRYGNAEDTPYLTYLILSAMMAVGGGIFAFCLYPDMYSIPILMGLVLTAAGLALWLRAGRDQESPCALYLALGSLCMALVAACRPQLLLLSALAIPLFWDAVVRRRALFSRRGLGATLAACLPYLAVALPLMWYNLARFGSPFDFGANYNLTTNDMTVRGYEVARIPLAFFTYFLQPPVITGQFPFLHPVTLDTQYMGVTIAESTYGGLFAVYPFAWLALLLFFRRRALCRRDGYATALSLFVIGILIALFDAQGAGILQRYYADFLLPILLSALIALLLCKREASPGHRRYWRYAILIGAVSLAIYETLLLLTFFDPSLGIMISFWG